MTTPTLSIAISCISAPEAAAATLASLIQVPAEISCKAYFLTTKEDSALLASLLEAAQKELSVDTEQITVEPPYGHAKAINTAAKASASDYLLLLQAGAQLTERTIPTLLSALTKNSSYGIAAPLHVCPDSGRVQACGTTFTPSLRQQPLFASFPPAHPAIQTQRSMQAVPLNGIMISAEAFSAAKMLDTGYRTGMENLALCCAIRNAGKTVEVIPSAKLLIPDTVQETSEDDLSLDTMRLNKECEGCFGPDKHVIAKSLGYQFAISPWLESYMTLSAEREQELTDKMLKSPDPATCMALLQEEPLWQTGYAQLAAYLEATGSFDEACGIRLLQTLFFPMLPLYRKLAAVAEAANNEQLMQMANTKLEHIDSQLEDIGALTKKAAGLANWARKAGEKELQAVYEGWLKELGLL